MTTKSTEYLTTTQAAKRLHGAHPDTIRRLAVAGEFPQAFLLGSHWRIPATDVDAYIERQRARVSEAGGES